MGGYWWLLLIGVAMWVALIAVMIFGKKVTDPGACPECKHEAGLDVRRRRCENADGYAGWGSDQCNCQNDYHWNYESVG